MHLQLRAIKPRSTFTRAIIYRPFLIIGQRNSPRPVGGIKIDRRLREPIHIFAITFDVFYFVHRADIKVPVVLFLGLCASHSRTHHQCGTG